MAHDRFERGRRRNLVLGVLAVGIIVSGLLAVGLVYLGRMLPRF